MTTTCLIGVVVCAPPMEFPWANVVPGITNARLVANNDAATQRKFSRIIQFLLVDSFKGWLVDLPDTGRGFADGRRETCGP